MGKVLSTCVGQSLPWIPKSTFIHFIDTSRLARPVLRVGGVKLTTFCKWVWQPLQMTRNHHLLTFDQNSSSFKSKFKARASFLERQEFAPNLTIYSWLSTVICIWLSNCKWKCLFHLQLVVRLIWPQTANCTAFLRKRYRCCQGTLTTWCSWHTCSHSVNNLVWHDRLGWQHSANVICSYCKWEFDNQVQIQFAVGCQIRSALGCWIAALSACHHTYITALCAATHTLNSAVVRHKCT